VGEAGVHAERSTNKQQQPYQPQTAGFSDISGGNGYNQTMPQQMSRAPGQMIFTQSTVIVRTKINFSNVIPEENPCGLCCTNCCTCSFCGVDSCCNDCWDGGEYGGRFPISTFVHGIAEILLEVALKHKKSIKFN
jgi:hypothetical protein